MGKTVAQLDRELSPDELVEWQAYYQLEPWGSPAADWRADVISRLTWFANGFKGDPPDFFDWDFEETKRLKDKHQASISLEDKIDAFFGGINVIEADEEPPVA